MNLFVLKVDPIKAAQHACDKHVVKMPTEVAQMLCVAFYLDPATSKLKIPFKKTHSNHICSRWVRASEQNYLWTLQHGVALCEEYYHRYGSHKVKPVNHKSLLAIQWAERNYHRLTFEASDQTPFVTAMKEHFRVSPSTVANYRNYYVVGKPFLRYTRRLPPRWLRRAYDFELRKNTYIYLPDTCRWPN